MRVVGVANRRGEAAVRAYADVGVEASRVEGRPAIENVLASGGCVATEDAIGLATADGVDVVVELTGAIEFAANVVLAGIDAGKHIVQTTAALDGTHGPILKRQAGRAGGLVVLYAEDELAEPFNKHRVSSG